MNVFEALNLYGNDELFEPSVSELHLPTESSPGSAQKIAVLRRRVELGLPLWHERDECILSVVGTGTRKNGFEYPIRARIRSCGKALLD